MQAGRRAGLDAAGGAPVAPPRALCGFSFGLSADFDPKQHSAHNYAMTFAEWAAAPVADGMHRFASDGPAPTSSGTTTMPLDVLHPLRHGMFAVELEVRAGHITRCAFDLHANHRGDEKLLEVRDVRQGLALIDRHGWLTAPFAETLYARIIEGLLGVQVSPRAAALRELSLAINATAVDALWEYLEGSLVGADPGDALLRRADVIDELEALTGARMHSTYVRIGGVAEDVTAAQMQRLRANADARVATAAGLVQDAEGAISIALPKVLRIPQADSYAEVATPHGTLGIWVVGRGDKVPFRVHLRTPGFAALATLEREAVGLPTHAFFMRLARTRLVLGEVSR